MMKMNLQSGFICQRKRKRRREMSLRGSIEQFVVSQRRTVVDTFHFSVEVFCLDESFFVSTVLNKSFVLREMLDIHHHCQLK